MKHSEVVPLIILKKEKLSIIEIAKLVTFFYKELSVFDRSYSQLNIISGKKILYQSIDVNDSNAPMYLAEEILKKNIDDIRKINKVHNPDINFSRDDMINFGIETRFEGETLITLNYSFSTKLPRIASIIVNQKCFDTFLKAKYFLEVVGRSFPIEYSVIKISDRSFNKIARGYKAPLGWITYFSSSCEISIPDDLEGVEYEHMDEGKYLILSRDDIAADAGKLESGKQKLVELMEQVAIKYPAYSRRFTPPLA